MACVVIRSTIVGKGSEITKALLKRGISVLQEHPVCLEDVAECLRLARQQGCHYQVNTHYPHVPAVRQFIAYLHEAMQTQNRVLLRQLAGFKLFAGCWISLGVYWGHFHLMVLAWQAVTCYCVHCWKTLRHIPSYRV